MSEQYKEAKKIIESCDDIKVYSHIDCDGICSGAILSTILDRQNKDHEIEFVNLDVLDNIELTHELTIFSDLGSGQKIDANAKKGQKIMLSGNSGNSSGPHLHFEVRKSPYNYNHSAKAYGQDSRVNPLNYM